MQKVLIRVFGWQNLKISQVQLSFVDGEVDMSVCVMSEHQKNGLDRELLDFAKAESNRLWPGKSSCRYGLLSCQVLV